MYCAWCTRHAFIGIYAQPPPHDAREARSQSQAQPASLLPEPPTCHTLAFLTPDSCLAAWSRTRSRSAAESPLPLALPGPGPPDTFMETVPLLPSSSLRDTVCGGLPAPLPPLPAAPAAAAAR